MSFEPVALLATFRTTHDALRGERALADRAQRFAELEMLVGREAPIGEVVFPGAGGVGRAD